MRNLMVKVVLSAALLMFLGSAAYAQTTPPELAPIGAQSVDENVLLTISVSATDGDFTTPVLSTSALPSGALFTDNLDGTGSFSWTPTYAQSGTYNVTFYASDLVPPDVDSEIVAITVNDVPQAPVVTDIPNQTIAEGATFTTISLDGYVSDVDNTDAEMTWTYSGNTALTVSIDVNRVATITIPSADWNG
ncbi:MAG: putative Ig domain-containing protein, partial [candidate division Zixibacteria bacterium]|nr:putative Ig domain-containing protein [candidate division Zixibacteria bacterium]